ncbi:pantoate--beta-alanine ligase [Maribius pontilimi]|uniref:Pantothenate synthetase n=1 Tax=Palleronia pontilimi TaxID=1964209 RepID=A0A934IGB4_9RHOB|nr:pantoate--beta-alanine ligase [Palleronia pontilimi]MBJ3762597.1 pantoate--beta-alanine ligase [Palleronia pontilimi]
MKICRTKQELRTARAALDGTVGLVPTMGALHDGHLSLVRRSLSETDHTVATIFVNPSQFGPNEDLATYPRTAERDLGLLEAEGIAAVFMPSADEMYDETAQTIVETTHLARILIGRIRPGHFRGVATVVTKLLNLAQPDAAFFGQKDYQQLCVIRTMVRDLDVPVRIVGVPTMREADGLAMSSRNVRLTPEHRAAAPALNDALNAAQGHVGVSVGKMRKLVRDRLQRAEGADIASIDIRDAETLAPVTGTPDQPVVILLAVRFGDVLLIDNRVIQP